MLQGRKGAFWHTLEVFSKHWDRIDVLCPKNQAPQLALQNQAFFGNVYFHPSPYGLWFQPLWIVQEGSRLISEFHHDAMTVHEYPPFYNGLGARFLAKRHNVPSLMEIHHIVGDPIAATLTEGIGYLMTKLLLGWDSGFATAVRTVNHSVAKKLASFGVDPKKIQVIPSFYLDRAGLERIHAEQKQFDVVFAARFVANKGWKELLHALRDLPGVTLLMLGDGPDRRKSEMEAENLGISDRVTFRGWLPTQEALWQAMAEAKVFVMPSKSEGGPRVALEAMGLGLPVVATKVGVMPDVIRDGHNGFFTTGTPEDLAQTIMKLLADSALRERVGTAATSILEKFERASAIENYAKAIHALIHD